MRIFLFATLTFSTIFTAEVSGKTPGKVIQKKQPVERNTAIRLLGIARDKLSNEAARLQIQGKGLSKREITRLNTLYKSVGRIREIISSLENSALEKELSPARQAPAKTGSLRKVSK